MKHIHKDSLNNEAFHKQDLHYQEPDNVSPAYEKLLYCDACFCD